MEKIKVLYIDDEVVNLHAFKASFRRVFDIYIASSAEEGVKILENNPIEVIMADQRMPGTTGVAFFESILDLYPNPIRILLTAYSDINAIIDAINKGQVYRYITKPWNDYEIKLTIENAYKLYRLKEQNNELNLKYKKVFVESSDPIFLFDVKGRITDYNKATLDLLQIVDETPHLKSFDSIIYDEKDVEYIMDCILKGDPVKDFECQILSSKNIKRNCLISINTITNNYDMVINYQAVIKDITERSKMNKMLLKTIIETQELERERFSKDLHDSIGQSLAAIKLHLDAIKNDFSEQTEKFNPIEGILENSIFQLRRICSDTIPPLLSDYGLIKAIDELCNKSSTSYFKINFSHSNQLPPLDKALQTAIYRIIQEFINNTLKHGQASEMHVTIQDKNGYITLNLNDNGIGFDINNLMIYKGQGLKNIKSRVESFDGHVNFNSAINKGTSFDISIPYVTN